MSRFMSGLAVMMILLWSSAQGGLPSSLQDGKQPPAPLQTIVLEIRGAKIRAEVARTSEEREKGLMHRKSLPQGRGMLFVFEHEGVCYFWMKDTLIPLDIAFVDASGKILKIKSMVPLNEILVSSDNPCLYALETNKGFFSKIHARPGDRVKGIPGQVLRHS